ncbi:polysaccharide deacetylase family protein [Streptomyces hainanensis]|uniref:Polysaccharide deacetylase family protein n=1 Tax=Streptomyces hainanensis TaxID=402648 RepID=A0A4R4TP26_9ACTN|nr:polysaccharide deacetylase family protein [Streptomyces hainanensis]TDC76933.1 polysaccharide deacetylase family protein [Streptomyces hainanensis]
MIGLTRKRHHPGKFSGTERRTVRRGRPALLAVVAAALVAATLSVPPSSAADGSVGRAAACENGYVGLTFDDGPNAATTPALLNALRAGGARATFFIWGQRAQQNPSLLQSTISAGMWIGNHTWTHPHLTQIGQAAVQDEISRTQNLLRQATGQTPTLFRPPYGETNAQVRDTARQLGITGEVLWNVDSRDWAGASTAQIVQAAATLRSGDIILMHDGYQTTVNAVPGILSGLSGRGLCPGRIVGGTDLRPIVTAP